MYEIYNEEDEKESESTLALLITASPKCIRKLLLYTDTCKASPLHALVNL